MYSHEIERHRFRMQTKWGITINVNYTCEQIHFVLIFMSYCNFSPCYKFILFYFDFIRNTERLQLKSKTCKIKSKALHYGLFWRIIY